MREQFYASMERKAMERSHEWKEAQISKNIDTMGKIIDDCICQATCETYASARKPWRQKALHRQAWLAERREWRHKRPVVSTLTHIVLAWRCQIKIDILTRS